jgi:hypothetical protein
MSHNRIKTILDSEKNALVSSAKTKTSPSPLSLSNFLSMAPLFLLAYLPIASANKITDGLELSSQTWYRFNYSLAEFAGFVSGMIDKCGMAFSTNLTNNTFEYAATPQCTQNGIPVGSGIEIGVEAGRNFTLSLVECMNKVMLELCKDYTPHPNPPHHESNHNFEVFMIVAGVVVLGGCLAALMSIYCCMSSCSNSSSYHHGYRSSDSSSSLLTGFALGSMFSSGGGGSSSSYGSSSSNSSSTGVSWSFGKSPV